MKAIKTVRLTIYYTQCYSKAMDIEQRINHAAYNEPRMHFAITHYTARMH